MKRAAVLVVLLLMVCAGMTVMAAENATITGDGLRLREHPTTDAGVLGSMDKGTRVEVLAHTEFTESIDGFTGYWYKIIYNGTIGYVFGKYIITDAGVYVPGENEIGGTSPAPTGGTRADIEDILGDWPMYYDVPNRIYSFYPDMTLKFIDKSFSDDGMPDENTRVITTPPVWGSFTFDGYTINATWNDGTTSTFIVKKEYGVTSLYINGQILPPELHMLSPDEMEIFHQYD